MDQLVHKVAGSRLGSAPRYDCDVCGREQLLPRQYLSCALMLLSTDIKRRDGSDHAATVAL
jgi:hypothetical protein